MPTNSLYLQAALESLLDKSDLPSILSALAYVCIDKSDHVRSEWQDKRVADRWAHAAVNLNACASTLPHLP